MLNSINNSSPSFGASVYTKGLIDERGGKFDKSSQIAIVKGNYSKAKAIYDFFDFIKTTDEGKQILDKLPEGDVIEFSIQYKPGESRGDDKLIPLVSIQNGGLRSGDMAIDSSDMSLKDSFEQWVDGITASRKEDEEFDRVFSMLTNPFTINEPDIREKDGVFFKKAGELEGTQDGGYFHKPEDDDLFNI